MRLRNNSKARSFLENSSLVIKSFPFVLKKGTTIELGMGKGQMLTTLALQNPRQFYIGIEKSATVAAKALGRSEQLKLRNFLIAHADAKNLGTLFQGQAETIWLAFSDPWPKARHAKRRLTAPSFLDAYQKVLARNGKVRLKTDDSNFFDYSIKSFQKASWHLDNITYDLAKSNLAKHNVVTEYEAKWTSAGKKISYLEAYKKA